MEARDDEREALINRMRRASTAIYVATEEVVADDISSMLRQAADLLARKPPEPEITDEMVERAAQATFDEPWAWKAGDEYTWVEMVREDPGRADLWRADARAVLEAALRVPVRSAVLKAPAWEYMERGREGDYIAYRRRAGSDDPWFRVPVGEEEQ